MDAYIYQADIYCADCGEGLKSDLSTTPEDRRDDSETYPQGPYADGGGEADSPQHCADCGAFLENPLTGDGRRYVLDAILDGTGTCVAEWAEFYSRS